MERKAVVTDEKKLGVAVQSTGHWETPLGKALLGIL